MSLGIVTPATRLYEKPTMRFIISLRSSLTFLLILGDVGYGVTARKDLRRSQSSLSTSSNVLSRASWSQQRRQQQQHRLERLIEDQSLLFIQLRGGGSDSDVSSNDYSTSDETRKNQVSFSGPMLSYSASPEATLPPALSGRSIPAFTYQSTIDPLVEDLGDAAAATSATSLPPPPNHPSSISTSYYVQATRTRRPIPSSFSLQQSLLTHPSSPYLPPFIPIPSPPNASYLSSLVKGGDDMAMRSFQLTSFRNRAVTAVLMMAFLGFLSYYFKEDGLIVFTVLLQGILFQEMTQVIGGTFTNPLPKWGWFLTAAIAWNGPKIMPWRGTLFQAVSYGMIMMSSIGVTLQLNWQKKKTSDFREYIRQAAVVAITLVLVVLPTSFWIATLEEYGMVWIFIPVLYMIINDTMAYVGGQLIGKHPLLPSISPKKTWEGFLVAALSTVGVAYLLGSHANKLLNSAESLATWYPLDKMDGMILAAFTSLVAPFGGFLGSIIKRAYGQKDFGAILPGHGGVVDRLDCQLIVAPAVYFYLNLFKFATDAGASGGTAASSRV